MNNLNLRRYRLNAGRRSFFQDTIIGPEKCILPLFVYEGLSRSEDLTAIYEQKKHTQDSVLKEIEDALEKNVHSFLLFYVPNQKERFRYDFDNESIQKIKKTFGHDILLWADVCLCSETHTGQCGVLSKDNVDNKKTVPLLVDKSLGYAQAGVDGVAPSDMMDSRIHAIRMSLDREGFDQTLLMSYSTKMSSHFYGPFRDAYDSTPKGDRKSYQVDPLNSKDMLRCSLRDAQEGADVLMVKPAGNYLDMIYRIKNHPQLENHPLCAYQVSGEYQGLKVMADQGLLDFDLALKESLGAIKRAGADFIITYGAKRICNWR